MRLSRTLARRAKPVFLWIKTNSHALRVVGGVMFLLALMAGVIWIAGYEIEAAAFTLGMLSSLFMASPSIAEFFCQIGSPSGT